MICQNDAKLCILPLFEETNFEDSSSSWNRRYLLGIMAWPHGLKNDKHERRLSSVLDRKALFFICISFLPSGHCGAKHIICMFRNPIISLGLIFLAPTEGRLEADDNLNPPLKCPQSTTFALFRVTMWLPRTLLTFSLFVSSSFAFLSHGSITVR